MRLDPEPSVFQPDLRRLAARRVLELLCHCVDACGRQRVRRELAAENPRALVAAGPRDGAARQLAVDVDAAVRDDFGARTDHVEHDQVAAFGIDLLTGAYR